MQDSKARPLFRRTLALPVILLGFASAVGAERLPVKAYTTADGLGHNDVHRIVRDSRGFLWFCTFEGLSRFDGYSFKTYGVGDGLPGPVVNDLLETSDGQYWIATGAGLCRLNPRGTPQRSMNNAPQLTDGAMFTVYFPAEDAGSKNILSLFKDSKGVIWCGTAGGLYRVQEQDGQTTFRFIELGIPTELRERSNVSSIIEDRRGALWIGSAYGIYRLLPDGRAEHYGRERNGLPSIDVHSLLEDREGRLWAGTRLGGLSLLVSDPDPMRAVVARVLTEKDGLPTKWINQIFQASDGSLWAGSNNGLIRFVATVDGIAYRFRAYGQPHGLTNQEVQSIAEDRNGNLWLGMLNGGAIKLARSGITAFGEADEIKWPTAIFKDRAGDLFVTGSTSIKKVDIIRFDGEKFTGIQLKVPKGFYRSWGWNQIMLEDQAGEWWYATGKGLYRFPKASNFESLARTLPKAVYTTRDGLASDTILRLFEDSSGDLWIGTVDKNGLSRWERSSGAFHHYRENDGLPSLVSFYPISFCQDRTGNIWIGFSLGGGLVRYRDGRFTHFTSADGLAEGGIFNLFLDSSGRLWIPTTRGGVCRIDDPSAEHPTFFSYTTEQGLSSNDVKSVAEDRLGRIYFGTARGIDRLTLATGRFKHYTSADGVLLGTSHAAMQDRDGALWFTSTTGLMRLVPEPDSSPLPPSILITGLRIAGDAQPISALGETEIASLTLDPDRNQLQIDFVALGFSPGERLLYQHKLEGTEGDWSPPSDQRTVNFASLAPGGYRFLVRAADADGVMSEAPASFSFTVLPPVWQRWWFIALAAALVGLVAYALYRYRVARLLELERVRTRIAADLHDDIGANLTKIGILSEVVRQQAQGVDGQMNEPLSSIARISRESVASMSDIVWAINPKRDTLRDLTRRMREFAGEIFANRDIEFELRAPADTFLKLGADVRRTLFLIFKEAVTNIVRHSDCSKTEIELRIEDSRLVLRVSDDGKGFDVSRPIVGNGLASIRSRAASMGGEVEIISRKPSGTQVTLRLPIKQGKSRRVIRREKAAN